MFVVVGTTRGDDLIPPETKTFAGGEDRDAAERERDRLTKERDDYLVKNQLPWWAKAGVIDKFEVKEVPSLS